MQGIAAMEAYATEIHGLEQQASALAGRNQQLNHALREIEQIVRGARYRPTSQTTLTLIEKIIRDAPLEPRNPTAPERTG